jgi:hypothetical protein
VTTSGVQATEISIDDLRQEEFIRHESLGGLLKYYERKAA